ncbi:formylmethanofuran dehydrogenase [Caballeronia sp. LjRoot31]|uniref:formylmethanofuran dehydrogenase n=1 Tax=Caballeronia sp. LjRoot31 TaxID=3342324 RepID=UPI003ECE2F37
MHLSSAPSSSVAQPSVRTAASSPLSAAAPSPEPGVRDWTCPFCPLLCDDITTIVHGDGTLDAPDVDCPRLARALTWSSVPGASQPAIDGQDTDLESALQRAADILKRASRPLFGGLATDVAGARALYPLAAGCGAILDHLHGDAMAASTAALQDRGGFFTTLSEVRTRADLLIIFDCQPSLRYPRFYERMLGGTDHARDLIFVGCEVDPAADIVENTSTHSILKDADPYDILAIWSALTQGRTEASIHDGTGNAIAHALADLAGRVSAARYAVVVYEPAALPGPHPALLIEAVNRIVKAANRTTRAGALALGGDDGALSVNQAVTWLSGLPLRTRVSMPTRLADQPQLDHDPQRYRTQRLLSAHEVDALLWVASFQPEPLPPGLADNVPAIVLGHPAMRSMLATRTAPTVFIAVATPGVDSGGHLFRVDGSVVAPLSAARATALPTVAAIAARLSGLLDSRSPP